MAATHRDGIARLCRLVLGDAELGEDVCQDVFIKVAATPPPDGADERRWLARVAINACHDVRRGRWWKTQYRRTDEFDESFHENDSRGPERCLLDAEQRERIHAALGELTERQRQVFLLRHFEGWSTEEVAEQLGLSAGSIKTHLFRAITALRDVLNESENE